MAVIDPGSMARPSPIQGGDWRLPLVLIVGLTVFRLLIAVVLPVTQDEAYYYNWARALAWGYFDHPPGVALLGIGTRLVPGSALAARLGAIAAGTLSLLVLWRFYFLCGLRAGRGLQLALVLAAATFPGLIAGIITTPDTVLALCWPLALHEALAALQGRRQRWLTAGVAVGLGLLGKYIMLVIGPIFLWAIIRADPRALRTRWPYLGALLALLVFLPNVLWNADNDWLTMRFQLGHGFATDTGALDLGAERLPDATGPMAYVPPAAETMSLRQRLSSLAGYLASQLGFWGLLLLPLAAGLLSAKGVARNRRAFSSLVHLSARPLLLAGTLFPLAFFGSVAMISDVEANWSALYLTCAAPIAAIVLLPLTRWALTAAALNLILVGVYSFHAATDLLPLPNAMERVMRETAGYAEAAQLVAALPGPVFADRYPYAAMLNFYQPKLHVTQWPGITRPSEYNRGRIEPIPAQHTLDQSGFWLFARKFSPPAIAGYHAAATKTIFACRGKPLQIIEGAAGYDQADCDKPLQVWHLYHYQPVPKRP
jgi:hypothetical protein